MWHRLSAIFVVSLLIAADVSCGNTEDASPTKAVLLSGETRPSSDRPVERAGGEPADFVTQERWTFAQARAARASGEIAAGETVRFVPGVVTAADDEQAFVQETDTDDPAGVFVQLGGIELSPGERVELEGPVSERFNVFTVQLERVQRQGVFSLPDPVRLTVPMVQSNDALERYESVLVTLADITVTSLNPDAPREFGEFQVTGGLRVDDLFYDGTPGLFVGREITITAPLYFSFGAFKLVPRGATDIVFTPVDCGDECDGCEAIDADNDGFNACVDCDDNRNTVFPGAPERCDGFDNNCDGSTLYESDEDGDGALDCIRCDDLGFFEPALSASSPSAMVTAMRGLTTFGSCNYDDSRDDIFEFIDEGFVETLYTGRFESNVDSWSDARRENINVEHSWPQSRGSSGRARCDIHHLFPSDEFANSRRGNHPFGLVVEQEWAQGGSRLGRDSTGQRVFEPRTVVRGDLARALTYWMLQYRNQSNDSFVDAQVGLFRAWNQADPVSDAERRRDDRIETIQGNNNPFVACPFLVDDALDVLD